MHNSAMVEYRTDVSSVVDYIGSDVCLSGDEFDDENRHPLFRCTLVFMPFTSAVKIVKNPMLMNAFLTQK